MTPRYSPIALLFALYFTSLQVLAQSTSPVLPQPGGGFNRFSTWMQAAVNFATGTFAPAVSLFLIIIAFVMWNLAPKEGVLMYFGRAGASVVGVMTAWQIVVAIAG